MTSTKWMGMSPESSTQDDVLQAIRELLFFNSCYGIPSKLSQTSFQTLQSRLQNCMLCVGCDVCKTIQWTTEIALWSILKQVQYYAACTGTCNWDFFLFQNYLAAKTMNRFIIKRAWSFILYSIISLHDLLWFFPKFLLMNQLIKNLQRWLSTSAIMN